MNLKNQFEVANLTDLREGPLTSPHYCVSITLRAEQLLSVDLSSTSHDS